MRAIWTQITEKYCWSYGPSLNKKYHPWTCILLGVQCFTTGFLVSCAVLQLSKAKSIPALCSRSHDILSVHSHHTKSLKIDCKNKQTVVPPLALDSTSTHLVSFQHFNLYAKFTRIKRLLWENLLYPPQTLFVGGILFSRCPSVRPCIRPSVRNALFP